MCMLYNYTICIYIYIIQRLHVDDVFLLVVPTWNTLIFSLGVTNSSKQNMSHEKNLGWLGFIGDYTIQFYGDYNKLL